MALILDHERKDDDAIAEYYEAVRANPRHAAAHYRIGRILKYNGKEEEASREFATACALEPRNPQVCRK